MHQVKIFVAEIQFCKHSVTDLEKEEGIEVGRGRNVSKNETRCPSNRVTACSWA